MAGADTENCIKQAHEFGLNTQMKIAALLIQVRGVRALGLEIAQGLRWSESYYWDLNGRTRAWNDRAKGKTPNGVWPNNDAGWRPCGDAALSEGCLGHGRRCGQGGRARGG
jgi:hypothetical protein